MYLSTAHMAYETHSADARRAQQEHEHIRVARERDEEVTAANRAAQVCTAAPRRPRTLALIAQLFRRRATQ